MQALKALVAGMGVLVVLGTAFLGYALYQRSQDPAYAPFRGIAEQPASAGGFGTVGLDLPAGCAITEARQDSGRLVIRVGPGASPCDRVILLDAASGRILGTVLGGRP